jgi:hypothetical protein
MASEEGIGCMLCAGGMLVNMPCHRHGGACARSPLPPSGTEQVGGTWAIVEAREIRF